MRFNYLSFGYMDTGNWKRDIKGRLMGDPNLLKRFQAKTIMENLDVHPGERLLDFGCGRGFFAIEAAKRGALAQGVDIRSKLPLSRNLGKGSVSFTKIQPNQRLEFDDHFFDKVLMSEVIVVLDRPEDVMAELLRVLKPGGELMVVHGLGPINIRRAYERNDPRILAAQKEFPGFPDTYEAFAKHFLKILEINRERWYTEQELADIVGNAGFENVEVRFPFAAEPYEAFSWRQVREIGLNNRIHVPFKMSLYLYFLWLGFRSKRKDEGTVIIKAKKPVTPK